MNQPLLAVRAVNKSFGSYKALQDINLDIQQGEFIAMLGPSGCGKTTLLRSIAGFLTPDEGEILIGGSDVTRQPPNLRPLNTVFQNYALFPHMKVLDNVTYGPRRHGVDRLEARNRSRETLEMVGLGHLADRYPRELSGGQQQRVALARALVNRPKLLLLDEPLSALDAKLRKHMQIELKRLQQKLGIAFIFVTHDQEEAMTIADRIVVMNAGKIVQIGDGNEIYHSPNSRFVADFVGEATFIPCEVDSSGLAWPAIGSIPLGPAPGKKCYAMVRPENLTLVSGGFEGLSVSEGNVVEVINLGHSTVVIVESAGVQVTIRSANGVPHLSKGQRVTVGYHPQHARLIGE